MRVPNEDTDQEVKFSNACSIVVAGEVLYDCFPDRKVLGGAPFNVAWNLQGMGLEPLFVSAVGDDADGHQIQQTMRQWGLSLNYLETDSAHPTGVVDVVLKDGKPSYTIVPERAYDFLKPPKNLPEDADAILYHGSLIFRNQASAETLKALKGAWRGRTFVDINIREPWFDSALLPLMLEGVDWLKLSDEEVASVLDQPFSEDLMDFQLRAIQSRYSIKNIIFTCGAEGAYWLDSDGLLQFQPSVSGITVKDTVGAGDAFASVCLLGITQDWSIDTILSQASQFAAKVCGMAGATCQTPSFYQSIST